MGHPRRKMGQTTRPWRIHRNRCDVTLHNRRGDKVAEVCDAYWVNDTETELSSAVRINDERRTWNLPIAEFVGKEDADVQADWEIREVESGICWEVRQVTLVSATLIWQCLSVRSGVEDRREDTNVL